MKGLIAAMWGAMGGATLAVALGATIASGAFLLVTAGTLQTFIGPGPRAGEAAPLPAAAMPTAVSGPVLQPTSDTPPVPAAAPTASGAATEPSPDGSTDPLFDPAQTPAPAPDETSLPSDSTDEPVESESAEPTPGGSGASEEPTPSSSPSVSPSVLPSASSDPAASPSSGRPPEPSPSMMPPIITSPAEAMFAVGSMGTFTVTVSAGVPGADITISSTGNLPEGLTFSDNGDGTASISGTPAAGTQGTYELTLTASSGSAPDATQRFTIHVAG